MSGIGTETAFSKNVRALVERVECRRVTTEEELLAVARLRYEAYLRDDVIEPNPTGMILDRYDREPGNHSFGFYIEGRLSGSLRLSVGSPDARDFPAMAIFPDMLEPVLAAGASMVDPTRFVLDLEAARAHPMLVYVALRLAWLVSDHLGVDYVLATVRTEHQAFYRRVFGHGLVCDPRPYLLLKKPLSLMVTPCGPTRIAGLARYPFLVSTRAEFETLWPEDRLDAPTLEMPAFLAADQILAQAPTSLG